MSAMGHASVGSLVISHWICQAESHAATHPWWLRIVSLNVSGSTEGLHRLLDPITKTKISGFVALVAGRSKRTRFSTVQPPFPNNVTRHVFCKSKCSLKGCSSHYFWGIPSFCEQTSGRESVMLGENARPGCVNLPFLCLTQTKE